MKAVAAVAVSLLLASAVPADAQQRFALIVSGAAGGPEYVTQYKRWTSGLSATLVKKLNFDPAFVTVLSDQPDPGTSSTAENVRRVIGSVGRVMTRDDVLLLVLMGHGTFDGTDAKFNLVGRDLESADWSALVQGLPGRLVIVNTASASFPFLERLAGPRRIVITATDSPAQRYDTVFPEYFVLSFMDPAADLDKNGCVSIWEAFAAASAHVRRHYQEVGLLSTERALMDDNGDGVGNDVAAPGDDGALASRTYLDEAPPGAAPTDDVLLKLLQRRAMLEAEVEELKIRKTFLTATEYTREFERIMIELARVGHDIRARMKS